MLVSVETHLLVRSTLNFCYENLKAIDLKSQVSLSSSLFLFLYPSLFPHDYDYYHTWTWFRFFFWFMVVLVDPWVLVVGFSRFHLSRFRFAFSYRKFICDMGKSLLSRCSSFSSEGLYSISVSAYRSSNNSWLTVFPQLHKE